MLAELPGGLPLEVLDLVAATGCARFIDPEGDTAFNQLQLPVRIGGLAEMLERRGDASFRKRLESVVRFLRDSVGAHACVKFVGD